MVKIKIRMNYDWILGYIRRGHRDGILELSDEDYEEFKKDPKQWLKETGVYCDLKLSIDDFSIEDHGDFKVEYKEL